MAAVMAVSAAVPAAADEPPVDTTAPLVTATGLAEGQIVGRTQQLRPTLSDDTGVVKVEVLIDEAVSRTYAPVPVSGLVVLALPAARDGADVEVTVRAFDAAGNSGSATTRVHVDTTAPQVSFSPPFESFVGGIVNVQVSEVPDLAKVVYYDHATGKAVASASAAPWILTWDTTGLPTGGRWGHFEVFDRAGNARLYYGFYAVDNTKPVIAVTFPAVGGRVAGTSILQASVTDQSPVSRVEWWVNGTLQASGPSYAWDTRGRNETAQLEVRAHDEAGNTASLDRTVTLDNAGPAVTAITPANRALVRGATVRTTVQTADASGIREARLEGVSSDTTAPYAVTAATGRDGQRKLCWSVTDRLGNTSRSCRLVIVDNTKPSLKVTEAPRNGAKVRGTVTVTASAHDRNGISRVELLMNGNVIAKDTKAGYAFRIKISKYSKKIKMRVRVYDKAGNAFTSATRTWHR
ncbi:Ig-like domain-containing protein [Actinoplanes sp. NPDC049316]|uniref:Ig-like domain-containing protein n=1 Tax=Actinoplanes sp. NPDC049316 TaxID=3154727 RepID=UPI003417C1AC